MIIQQKEYHDSLNWKPKTSLLQTPSVTDCIPSVKDNRHHLPPTKQDIINSVVLYVEFDLVFNSKEMPEIKDLQSFREYAKSGAFLPWTKVSGLRNKLFWLNPEEKRSGGLYTFFDKDSCDRYIKSEFFGHLKEIPFGRELKWEIHENLAGSEITSD